MSSDGPHLSRLGRAVLCMLAAWAAGSVVARLTGVQALVDTVFAPWPSVAVGAFAGLVVLSRFRAGRPGQAWGFVAAGLVVWNTADALTLSGDPTGVTGVASFGWVYVAAGLLILAGVIGVVRGRRAEPVPGLRLDAATTGLAVAALVTWLAVDPVRAVFAERGPGASPAIDVVLLTTESLLVVVTICGFALLRWRRDPAWLLATAATVSFLVAEAGYVLAAAEGTWTALTPTNAGWSGAAVLFALAAYAPGPRRAPAAEPGVADVVLPLCFAAASIVLLAGGRWLGVGALPTVLAGASLVTALARLTMTALAHAALLRASRIEARTDALTGLGNRRRFADDVDAILDAPTTPTALVLFDLDGFKAFNDRNGHPAGDALLIALGGELAAHVGVEHAYRLGGDEFCALVTAPEGGSLPVAIANAAAALRGAAERAGLGASHGAAVLGQEVHSRHAAVKLADGRLYADKERRRLRFTTA